MTVAQAADRIGISGSKLYQLISARAITFYRVGGKIIITDADVDAYVASCRVEAVTHKAAAPREQVKLKHLRLN